MPKLTIDNKSVDVPEGMTILDAAETVGVTIPTLCYVPGMKPLESCFVCAVHLAGHKKLVPACAMPVREGMEVTTDSPEVLAARKAAIELLLSDHLGECLAPCQLACPATWDVPGFMEAAGAGDWPTAASIAQRGLVLPGVLGCVCTAPCQKACRRTDRDQTVAIRDLHRHAAVAASAAPAETPSVDAKRVAIIGAGPAGLAAAQALAGKGYAATVFDAGDSAGGSLRDIDGADLPPDVLAADLRAVEAAGVTLEMNRRVTGAELTEMIRDFDAVCLAAGEGVALEIENLAVADGRVVVDKTTHAATVPGVFAAGACAGRKGLAVRVVADGLSAAESIHRFLTGCKDLRPGAAIAVRYGPLSDQEKDILWSRPTNTSPQSGPVNDATAVSEAQRCLLCGCTDNHLCKLRKLATEFGAARTSYVGERRRLDRDASHPQVAYEAHKCILCGACVARAEQSDGDALTYVGRGFACRVSGPYEQPMADALGDAADVYADLCPTSAFTRKKQSGDTA